MATPHGDTRRKLNAGFTDFATTDTLQNAQDGFEKSHTLGFDMCSTSGSLHSCLEPSILSMLENASVGEEKSRIDEESEATLLCALSDMLDSVIEETLSPFDTLPSSDLFINQRSQDNKSMRLHTLAVSSSEKEAAASATRSTRSSLSNGKVEASFSDRQLRPRLHRRTQAASIQRRDGEDEALGETRSRPVRIFRIEPDPSLCQDDHQDRFVRVSLEDLVRHMHPYSLRVALNKEVHRAVQKEEEEEDVYVDVEGDDEIGGELLAASSQCDPEQEASPSGIWAKMKFLVDQPKEEMLKMCPSGNQNKTNDAAQASQICGRVRKRVSFAADLTSIHVYQPEDEYRGDVNVQSSEDLTMAQESNTPESFDGAKSSKPRALSLQEYRLLREKMLPKKERMIDHRTKWPSVPKTPTELPPIHFISAHIPAQVNSQNSSANDKLFSPGSMMKARRNLHLPTKLPLKQKKGVHPVDPPNPVTVCLKPLTSTDPKTSPPPPNEQNDMEQELQPGHDAAQQASSLQDQPASARHEKKHQLVSHVDLPVKVVKSFPATPIKDNISAPSSPVKSAPVQTSQKSPAPVQTPATKSNQQRAEERRKESAAEIGIEATDVTSLLEQFETQGLTPPATPPHQIWQPLLPTLRAKQQEAKHSSNKTIQIIEPQPLPPRKLHSKPQLHNSVPALSITLAFMDHDYCATQVFSNKTALSSVYMHNKSLKDTHNHTSHKHLDNRTCSAELSGSILLSPESSPSRLEGSSVGEAEESEEWGPAVRGRTWRRCFRRRYRHSRSSSTSPSSSPSSSLSLSSLSPPRKRHRSRFSDSSSSPSSRSSSPSLSPSPIRERRRHYHQSRSRRFSRSRSRSCSPQDRNQTWSSWTSQRECYRQSKWEDSCRKQKAIEERRVVYVGRIHGTMTKDELWERFTLFGKIEDCSVHFRSHGDNYGFVTYYNTDDAFAAIENGTKLRQPDELPFDICFGGRRQFCQSNYMDLDSNRDINSRSVKSSDKVVDFDTLLKQAQHGHKT